MYIHPNYWGKNCNVFSHADILIRPLSILEPGHSILCTQRRFRSLCTFAQSDRNPRLAQFSVFFFFCFCFWTKGAKFLHADSKKKDPSRKHAYIYFDPIKPHFYIVKLGFTGVYIFFLISASNIDCGYSLEPPCRGRSNEYPQSMF